MAYQRSKLGQDEFTTFDPALIDYPPMETNPLVSEIVTFPSTDLPGGYAPGWWGVDPSTIPSTAPVAPATSSWSWSDIWKPVADVIGTLSTAAGKVLPAILKTTPQTGYPSPYPQTPSTKIPAGYYVDPVSGRLTPIPPGYRINPMTGGLLPIQAGMTDSPYFWPVALGLGAMFLVTSKKSRK